VPPSAHIVPDTEPAGIPTTPNGLALCKIHQAAYDQNMLGVSPDSRVAINREVLAEVDGPMLKHGMQEMHGRTITLPVRRTDRPDRELLAWRWERFARLSVAPARCATATCNRYRRARTREARGPRGAAIG